MTAPALLTVERLGVDYKLPSGTIHAVRDASFTLAPGSRTGFVGESGSGKTTIALTLMGMLRAPGRVVGGTARLGDTDLVGLAPARHAKLRLSRIAYVPQGAMSALNPVQTVRRSIADGLVDHGVRLPAAALETRIQSLLAQVGLEPRVADRYPHELSGGMRQRVCIAIAISLGPELIIGDEPTSALDVVTQRQVMETLRDVQHRLGSALLLIGHDMGLMAQCVDRLIVMRHGEIVEAGEVRTVLRRPAHPYTRELIASVPSFGERRAALPAATAAGDAGAIVVLDRAAKSYDAVPALHPISVALGGSPPGILAVVGESGSGKTTLGNIVLGFTPPTEGTIRYQDTPIAALDAAQLLSFRRDVQAVFQDPYSAFNPFHRVDRALSLPLRRLDLARNGAEIATRIEQACIAVGLDPDQVLGRFAHQLSGGQRQRLMVARALMLRPRLLVADEPVSMVDASLRLSILDALRGLRDRHGISILYITHDLATAYRVSDRVMVLRKGEVVEEGDPEAVLRAPRHAYTRLLVSAVPWPDPDRAWGSALPAEAKPVPSLA